MIYLNVLGQHFVILNSLEVTTDLFEKRSPNYSDRKPVIVLNELYVTFLSLQNFVKNAVLCRMNLSMSLTLMPYGPLWRKQRRLFDEFFHRNAVTKYQPIQRQEVQAFLRRLLVTPDNFFHHIRQ